MSGVSWGGCWNSRTILPGIWRASSLDGVQWDDVVADGVRTVIDLRNEQGTGGPCERVHVPLEAGLDEDPLFKELIAKTGLGSPLYYAAFCTRWRDRVAAAVRAVDDAAPGVVFHCQEGWDRTGMIAAILLKRAGFGFDAIVQDYGVTWQNADPTGSGPARLASLAKAGTTWQAALLEFLESDSSTF